MIPLWYWVKKDRKYIPLPATPQQFKGGSWGYSRQEYVDNPEIRSFVKNHDYLLKFTPDHTEHNIFASMVNWGYVVLKKSEPPTKVKWYSKDQASIKKVQR